MTVLEKQDYLDFEIEIDQEQDDGVCAVQLLRAPGGEATGTLNLAVLSAEARSGAPVSSMQQARTIGAELFEALFQGDLLSRFDVSLQLAAAQKSGLRVRLRLGSVAVRQLPWELLFDARRDEFLALSRSTPIVRYLAVGAPVESLVVQPPLRILALSASPSDLPPVDAVTEKANLQRALQQSIGKGTVEVVWLEGQTWRDLQSAMQQGPWHIFHYIGHARLNPESGAGELLLADDAGQSAPIGADALSGLLEDHKSLRLAVLNACEGARANEAQPFASLAAALVRSGMAAVLAMQQEISTTAAQELTRAFYGALGAGIPVDGALGEARKAMNLAAPTSTEWATPALFLRAPDAALWETLPVQTPWRKIGIGAVAALTALAAIWALVWFWLLPTFFPSQMQGSFRLAVADFGALNADGSMGNSAIGSVVSKAIYEQLENEYGAVRASSGLFTDLTVWHDSAGRAQKNVTFGAIEGASAEERAANARALADRIDADMVIYGYMQPPTASQPGDALALEFYYRAPELAGEPAPTAGNLRFGSPLLATIPSSVNAATARTEITAQALRRADALFWITQALTFLLVDRPNESLQVLEDAGVQLARWPDDEGKELLYLYKAQAAQVARNFDVALDAADAALRIRPDYVNAILLKGAVLLDRAQLHYLDPARLTPEQLACTTLDNIANASPTDAAAEADAAEAVRLLEEAVALAPDSPWPPIERQARLNLGLAYRLLGQTELNAQRFDAADTQLNLAVGEFDHALESFSQETQPQYYGWTLAGLGTAQLTQGALRYTQSIVAANNGAEDERIMRNQEAVDLLTQAIASYGACTDLRSRTAGNPTFQKRVLDCSCQLYGEQAQSLLDQIGGAQ